MSQPSTTEQTPRLLPAGAKTFLLLTLVIFLLAGGVRGLGIVKGPAEFQPVRQYYTALIARYLYQIDDPGLSAEQRTYLEKSVQRIHEPPLTEWISIQGYKLTGGEKLWIPRVVTACAWLVGGWFLLLLLRRLVIPEVALAGTAFYLFLPFGIALSLSFQPDSLMMAAGLAAIYFLLKHHDSPSRRSLFTAALVCALAITLKAQIVFALAGCYAGLALLRKSPVKLVMDKETWMFAAVALTPPVLYLAYNFLVIGGIFAQQGMIPSALLSTQFYMGWLYMLDEVIGFPLLVLGVLGLAAMRGTMRGLALGAWFGYALFGMVFTYHFATHAYYHIPVILPVTLGLAALLSALFESLRGQNRVYAVAMLLLAAGLALLLDLGQVARGFNHHGIEAKAPAFAEIGEKVGHSNQVLMYAQAEGLPLIYHARITGWLWPTSFQLAVKQMGLKEMLTTDKAAHQLSGEQIDQLVGYYRKEGARYFVVAWMEEFRQHPELERYFSQTWPSLAETAEYRVYDLTTRLKPGA